MKKILSFTLFMSAVYFQINAQQQDAKNIDALCGCFEVTFNYAETFVTDTNNKYYAKPLDNRPVIEYVFPIEKSDKKIVLQHVLVVNDQMMIKHWREDWTYEHTTLWKYDNFNQWSKTTITPAAAKGTWTQSVWEVSDALRYQGASQWVNTNNQTFWLNTADAPLPRREYTKRRDYNVMNRTNRLILKNNGYMHEQDNIKILRKDGQTDQIIGYEKGYNEYIRVDDSKCEKAKAFWMKNQDFWKDVRNYWEVLFNKYQTIILENRVNGKVLHDVLFELEKQGLQGEERTKSIKKVLDEFTLNSK